MKKRFDVAVLGGGPGGYPAAIRLAQAGKKVALIEERELGGTCLNRGCIPTKALLHVAHVFSSIKEAEELGIRVAGSSIDWTQAIVQKGRTVAALRSGVEGLLRSNGVEVLQGRGRLTSANTLSVGEPCSVEVCAEHLVLATGSEPKTIPVLPFDGVRILSSTEALDLPALPESVTIVGGGAIGCEFASLFSDLGSPVVIVEALSRLLPLECPTLSDALAKNFAKRGISVLCGERVVGARKGDGCVEVTLQSGKSVKNSIVLVAIGRTLNTQNIGLEDVGVRLERGAVVTDDRMATNIPGIWAVGDITATYQYAHVATRQGLVAAENILGGSKRIRYDAIPGALFLRPEVASVGLSLEGARAKGFAARLVSIPMQAIGRARACHSTEGFAQLVFEEGTGRILGGQAFGCSAAERIVEIGVAISNELTIECIDEAIHPHPTYAEAWVEGALLAQNRPLHVPGR